MSQKESGLIRRYSPPKGQPPLTKISKAQHSDNIPLQNSPPPPSYQRGLYPAYLLKMSEDLSVLRRYSANARHYTLQSHLILMRPYNCAIPYFNQRFYQICLTDLFNKEHDPAFQFHNFLKDFKILSSDYHRKILKKPKVKILLHKVFVLSCNNIKR